MAKWIIDPNHAVAEFTVYHMMVTPVHGQFNSVKGSVEFDPADPGAMSVEVEIEAAGLYTGVERRDNHLRSADFFDVASFPAITFKSTTVTVIALNNVIITGDLTMHGITRSIAFRANFIGPSKFYDDELKQMYTTFGFHATASIDREDFGMMWNVGIEDGGFMVGKTIDLAFNAEIDREE